MSRSIKVPLFSPDLGPDEEDAVLSVLRGGWIAMGPRCAEFEERFAAFVGARNAVALNSCTAALHLAYRLAGLGPGDECIVPSLTFVATANAVAFTGAQPVFADVTSVDDWTLSVSDVEQRITPATKAVCVMHYAGYPCDMSGFAALCEEHGLVLLEDACHGLGGSFDGKGLGTLGAMGCFSFYSNKIMTTAEGGMLVTDDATVADRARLLRAHGMTATAYDRSRGARDYEVMDIGHNYRMDDLRAALGLVQLGRVTQSLDRRRELASRYQENLKGLAAVHMPRHGDRGVPALYVFPILVEGLDRDALRAYLDQRGVQTSLHYRPSHRFPAYASAPPLPITEWVTARTLTLPLFPSMSDDQVDYVCGCLADGVAKLLAP